MEPSRESPKSFSGWVFINVVIVIKKVPFIKFPLIITFLIVGFMKIPSAIEDPTMSYI